MSQPHVRVTLPTWDTADASRSSRTGTDHSGGRHSATAHQRAVTFGDLWPPLLMSFDTLHARVQRLRQTAADRGPP